MAKLGKFCCTPKGITHLLRPLREPPLLVPISLELRPEERAEVVYIQQPFAPVLLALFRTAHEQLAVEVDDLIVQPLCGSQPHDVLIRHLLFHAFRNDASLTEECGDRCFVFRGQGSGQGPSFRSKATLDLLIYPQTVETQLVKRGHEWLGRFGAGEGMT